MTNFAGLVLLCVGATLILLTISLLLRRGVRPGDAYNTPARFFLVVLRLAIGWHFLFEGLEKMHTPAWSGEPYLRESYGPLGSLYRGVAGDRVAEKLTVTTEGELPPLLAEEWAAYEAAFAEHYGLDAEQRAMAEDKLRQAKKDTVTWLTAGQEEVVTPSAYPPELKVAMTVPDRLKMYEKLQERVAAAEAELPSSDPDLQKRWKDAKADLAKWRAGLKKSLDGQTAKMREKLNDVLTSEQKAMPTLPPTVPLPMGQWRLLEWSDFLVMWGLLVIGGLLLVGLFSRLASLAGALLVLSFYLAMPPLPGWPEVPRLEGHYLLVNKTLIEVFALGALAFIPTGRWLGLDALVQFLFPSTWRSDAAAVEPARTRTVPVTTGPTQPVA